MYQALSYSFRCPCGRESKWNNPMPDGFGCECGRKYKKKTQTIEHGILKGHKTIGFELIEEVNTMEIKVNRKEVDKKEKIKEEFIKWRNGYGDNSGKTLFAKIDEIFANKAEGEIKSIEIKVPVNEMPLFTMIINEVQCYKIKLTPEQLKEINKAVESK